MSQIELLFRAPKNPDSNDRYDGGDAYTEVLPAGYKRWPDARCFEFSTVYEKDVKIPMRDGTVLRADIFRPEDNQRVPAILPWSPYGKSGRGLRLTDLPGRMGIPKSRLSGFEKFEAPDPAEWTARGYAVVNIDSRGSWDSEGYLCWAGTQEGRDGYDVIEWIAKQTWCNGSICLAGNSWLGRSQWYIAAERPPSLKCIAPLEGSSDLYREIQVRGGIPCTPFLEWQMAILHGMPTLALLVSECHHLSCIWVGGDYTSSEFVGSQHVVGRGKMEDPVAMVKNYPLMNEYWRDKRARIDRIEVPAYVLASYSTFLHLPGSLRGYEEITHNNKWLRVHATQEWHDLYQESTSDELQLFFDRYAKGVLNGFENTIPRVRVSLIGFNTPNIINAPFASWPIRSTRYERMHLASDEQLLLEAPAAESIAEYRADVASLQMDEDCEELHFRYTFATRTYLVGSVKAVLSMSCAESDDMDVFLQIRKADTTGKMLRYCNVPKEDMEAQGLHEHQIPLLNSYVYLGPHGQIRASHRAADQDLSKPHYIQHSHEFEKKVTPGSVVSIATSIWPGGMVFDKGESMVFKVSGHPMYLAEFAALRGQFKAQNVGNHQVHLGGSVGSYIEVPFVEM